MRVRQAFIVSELPSGTVTFLFTDIEGSTALVKRLGGRYSEVLAEHQRILREAFAAHHGHEVDTQGDSFFAAFPRAKDAVAAAVDAQRDLSAHSWPEGEAATSPKSRASFARPFSKPSSYPAHRASSATRAA